MKDVKEVIQTMLDELNELAVPKRDMTQAEYELYRLHETREALNNALQIAIGEDAEGIERELRRNKQVIDTSLEAFGESQQAIIPTLELKEQQFQVLRAKFGKALSKIFEKAVKETDDESFPQLKKRVGVVINTDRLNRKATKKNPEQFHVALNAADEDTKPLPMQEFGTAYDSAQVLREVQKAINTAQDGSVSLQDKFKAVAEIAKKTLKTYPKNATEQDIQETDAHNLELLTKVRDLLAIPGFTPVIDILYQFYRYPNFIKNVIWYLTAVINAVLILGVVLGSLVIGLTSNIITSLRTFLERFYLNQFDESLRRKGYIHFGKDAESKEGKTIDDTGLSDDQYAARGKQYFMDSIQDDVAGAKIDACISAKTVISLTREAQIAIGKVIWESQNTEMNDDETDADNIYINSCKTTLDSLLDSNMNYELSEIHSFVISEANCIGIAKSVSQRMNQPVDGTGASDKSYLDVGKTILKSILKPGLKLQLTDADFTEEALLTACKGQMHDFGLNHYGYAFSSLFDDFTKPLAPEDNLFKTGFLRILRLCLALPAVMLVSFPLAVMQELGGLLIKALLLMAVSIKLLSAIVFALPLYVYDALSWAARCCQPAPEADKNRCFNFVVMGLFETIRANTPKPEAEPTPLGAEYTPV